MYNEIINQNKYLLDWGGNNFMNASKKAVLFTFITSILWSTSGLFIKLVEWDYLAIVFGKALFTAIPMYFMVKKTKILWSKAVIGGAISYAAFTFCITLSTKLTTSSNAVLMQYTAPVYVAILSGILLKEKVLKLDWICLGTVLIGMALFFIDKTGGGSVLGNIIAIGNGISFAGMAISLRMQQSGNPEQSVFLGNVLAAILSVPFAFRAGLPSMKSILVLIFSGIVLAISYELYSLATKHLTALQSVLIPVLDPVLNPVWVFLAIGEKPGIISFLGGLIILIAVTLRSLLIMKEKTS